MLELRPSCEHCTKPLPPASLEARICSYECTFCAACPARNWKDDNYLGKDPAGTRIRHRPVDAALHAIFATAIRTLPPERR